MSTRNPRNPRNILKAVPMTLLFAGSVAALGCADPPAETDLDPAELDRGLALGKADSTASDIEVYSGGLGVRGAAARTIYNLLHDADAYAYTQGGRRTLLASGMGCVTDGVDTYCLLVGPSDAGSGGYEAVVHGGSGSSAAASLYGLIADGSGDSFVSVPWLACEVAGSATWCGVETSEVLTLTFDGLEDSGDHFVYEGWAVSGGVATTTDRFRAGPVVTQRVPSSIADDSLYVLTIEPRRGDPSAPAKTHLVAGPLDPSGVETDLVTEHPAALGTDFAGSTGGYVLATPTSAVMDDETQGIWFVDPAAGAPSLDLPELPDGWVYEGWVVSDDGPISTGRFRDVSGDDSDGAGPTAGPGMSPPFPGQDFVTPPLDLVGATVVISAEPEPDNEAAPFAIKPLIDATVDSVMAPMTQSMENHPENRPSATARFGH